MLYFIVNPTARTGQGKKVWDEIQAILENTKTEYRMYLTERKGHAGELAAKLCDTPEENVNLVVVGGDGTINEVLNGITDFDKIRMGLIPGGSGNDFAHGIGLSADVKTNLEKIIAAVAQNTERKIDLGCVRYPSGMEKTPASRIFGISSGIGLDAIVSKKALDSKLKSVLNKIHLGKLTYTLLTVQTLFSMKTTSATVRYFRNGKTEEKHYNKLIFAVGMNMKAEGGGVPMAPKATALDGHLELSLAHGIPKWKTFFKLPLLLMEKQENVKGFEMQSFEKCEIVLEEAGVLHADGEYLGEHKKITIECLPGKLRMMQ